MSFENPFQRPPSAIEHEKARLPAKRETLEGEVLADTDEDPRIQRKFDQLPVPVAEFWRKSDVATRRIMIADQQILDAPVERLVDLFVQANPQFQDRAELMRDFDERFDMASARPGSARGTGESLLTQAPNDVIDLEVVHPKLSGPEEQRLAEIKQRLLGNK